MINCPNCIVCGKHLKNFADGSHGNWCQPLEALEFISYGHYGSAEFDPMNGSRLSITICDSCIRLAKDQGKVLLINSDGTLGNV